MELKTVNDYIDNIPRCLKCNLIPSLKLKYNDKKDPSVIYKCERGHEEDILLEKYMNEFNKNSLTNEKCEKCGKSQKEMNAEKSKLQISERGLEHLCTMCYENPIQVNLSPCGHRCLCSECYKREKENLEKCPICNKEIKDIDL